MARTCGATATLMLFGFLLMSFSAKTPIPAPHAIESTKTSPNANFTFLGSACGLPTCFYNLSTQYNTCSWDFGDGTSSTATNPQHTYASPGSYQVRLTVYGNDGTASFIGTVDVVSGWAIRHYWFFWCSQRTVVVKIERMQSVENQFLLSINPSNPFKSWYIVLILVQSSFWTRLFACYSYIFLTCSWSQ